MEQSHFKAPEAQEELETDNEVTQRLLHSLGAVSAVLFEYSDPSHEDSVWVQRSNN